MADDLGCQDVGFMGSQYFETPNLDALANQSLVFEKAYMYPTCSPSRAALLTGRQSFRTGCYTVPVLERGKAKDNIFSRWTVGLEHPVYAEPLSKADYNLIHLGKWHIVGPHPEQETKVPLQRKPGQPKNGNLSWLPAHQTPEIQRYYPADPVTGQGTGRREEIAAYATMVKSVDENVQRIVNYLDQAGLRVNTIVFFTSDIGFNGLQSDNHNLRGAKGHVYEGGVRVLALVNWPQTVAPGRTAAPIQGLDYFSRQGMLSYTTSRRI